MREVSAYHYTELGYYISSLCLIFAAPYVPPPRLPPHPH